MASPATPSKLVRLSQDRADRLDVIREQESRTQVAQLGIIFDAGVRALGLQSDADQGEPVPV